MMDREVNSVGESSSSKRVKASRCIGGGTSHLRGRAWISIASEEPIPVNVILPLLLLRE